VSLSAADVAEIMRLVEQSQFDELMLEMDGVKLTLRRGGAVASSGVGDVAPSYGASPVAPSSAAQKNEPNRGAPSAALAGASPGGAANTAADTGAPKLTALEPGVVEVPSPLLGTFYRSPKPGAAPFVEPGATVEEDTVVAIIEVMKLMNTVRAGVRGTVTEVLAADGALVEYEQPLFRVRKAG
jgi:acetyl-CoA carboxylase biotin carboxyl carrier protein